MMRNREIEYIWLKLNSIEKACLEIKMRFEDLTDEHVQIIKKGNDVYNVLRFSETILHRHKMVVLMSLNQRYKSTLITYIFTIEEFNNEGFEEIFTAKMKRDLGE